MIRRRWLSFLSALLLIACTAPATEQPAAAAPDPAGARQAIEAANTQLAAALNRGDVPASLSHYTADAVIMQPGMPALRGPAAAQEAFTGMLQAMSLSSVSFRTDEITLAGDYAIEAGSYTMTVTPKGAAAMADSGKYLTIWQKQADGTWKVVRDINNTDVPPKM
ncbi:MAG: YybH family protein [Gemmatimonadaceae bacterium]